MLDYPRTAKTIASNTPTLGHLQHHHLVSKCAGKSGLTAMHRENENEAQLIYDAIDQLL